MHLRTVTATRYVTPLREGGSLPALVEADDDGLYVLKFRGAGQGPKALTAELVAGEIGRALGLPVPELVFVELDPALAGAEPDPEIQDLLQWSAGLNLGMDFLPGSLPFSPAVGPRPDPAFAADVVWFDAYVANVDRTPRNTNLLVWGTRTWLIDHGAALYVHHQWGDPAEQARRPFTPIRDHVLLPFAGSIAAADARLAPRISAALIEAVMDLVPEAWLEGDATFTDPAAHRRAYVEYLLRRLESPRAFAEEAERVRPGA
jgi:hypothetical protein